MATIREWLDWVEFDWERGKIILQNDDPIGCLWDGDGKLIAHDDAMLDTRLEQPPHMIAEDGKGLYVVAMTDRGAWIQRISKDTTQYLTQPIPIWANKQLGGEHGKGTHDL